MKQPVDENSRERMHSPFSSLIAGLAMVLVVRCAAPSKPLSSVPRQAAPVVLPSEPFTHAPEKPHDPAALFFTFDQLEHDYRVPGEFTHRLTGDEYGFQQLSFIVSETHPGGGPGLHVHDVEEAHILLQGTAEYRVGEQTFIVHAPYIAKVPAGVPHTFINAGTEPFNLVAVFASKHPKTTRVGPNPLIGMPPKTKP
jgi:mannose-6-phosphate isomerase-like protein (cupin superfamily)